VEEVDDLLDHVDGLDVLLAPDEALHAVVVPLAQELQQPQDRPRVRRQRWVQPQAPGRDGGLRFSACRQLASWIREGPQWCGGSVLGSFWNHSSMCSMFASKLKKNG